MIKVRGYTCYQYPFGEIYHFNMLFEEEFTTKGTRICILEDGEFKFKYEITPDRLEEENEVLQVINDHMKLYRLMKE